MNTIKAILAESGRIADVKKDFPLYQGQFQNKLLNVLVPTSILAPDYEIQHYIGQSNGTSLPSNTNLQAFVLNNTSPSRNPEDGDIVDFVLERTTDVFYRYVFRNNNWNSTIVDSFGIENVAGTSVKIGMTYTALNGAIKKSKSYYMRYLKTLTYMGVEYALYERKLPKEFTYYSGQGINAPTMIINVINISTETQETLGIVTSQTCKLDVMPSSVLDKDEAIEPSELDIINAQINEINSDLALKQDKQDISLQTNVKTVVGGINELKNRVDINQTNIENSITDVTDLRNDVDYILENFAQTEDYIGQLTGNTLPTPDQLTQFVREHTSPSREPKNADVVIFVLDVADQTDRNYKYIYSTTGWNGYEIPPLETANNGTLGIVMGTYNIGDANNTLVDISTGKILNIYVKDSTGAYRNIVEYLNTTTRNIADIVNGNTVVGEALKATQDRLGQDIVNTYLTQTAGATKQYVRDYALPRTFNDIYFISSSGYSKEIPTSPVSGIQFTRTTNAVGDFELFNISQLVDADYELSQKNSYQNKLHISSNNDCNIYLRLTTQARKIGLEWVDLNVELTNLISLRAGEITRIDLGSTLDNLSNSIMRLVQGDTLRQILEIETVDSASHTITLYSSSVYPSSFNLNTQAVTFAQGMLGEQQSVTAVGTLANNLITFDLPISMALTNNAECEFILRYNGVIPLNTQLRLKFDDQIIRLATPYNIDVGNALASHFNQVAQTYSPQTGTTYIFKGFIKNDGESDIVVRVAIDNIDADVIENLIEGSDFIIAEKNELGNKIVVEIDSTKIDEQVEEDSQNLITSGAVFNALAGAGGGTPIIINVPETATQGTLTETDINILQESDQNYIVLNNEIYKLSDKQQSRGFLIYSHLGEDSTNNFFAKCISITLNNRTWVLTSKMLEEVQSFENIIINNWNTLQNSSPYTYQATISPNNMIYTDSVIELINDQPILFAKYGFAIASVSGQNITIYSIGRPTTAVTLKLGLRS